MRRDPKEFRERFLRWKAGELVYDNGLPKYQDGKEESNIDELDYKDMEAANTGYLSAKDFVQQYSKSAGFYQRLVAGKWKDGFRNSNYDPAGNGKYIWEFKSNQLQMNQTPVRGSDGPKYNYVSGDVEYIPFSIPLKQDGKIVANTYDEIFSHELGHALDSSIYRYAVDRKNPIRFSKRDVWNAYSRSIPMLRQNKLYLNIIKQRKPSDERRIDTFLDYTQDHDAFPEENYADLIQMRYLAQKYGIFNSLKPNVKFTKEHLNKYKKLNTPKRLLNNFSDELIIWMMNNVADTNKHTDNEV